MFSRFTHVAANGGISFSAVVEYYSSVSVCECVHTCVLTHHIFFSHLLVGTRVASTFWLW